MDCTCLKCVAACHSKPGWFLPGEISLAASLVGLNPQAFAARYLTVEEALVDGERIAVPRPRKDARGCVFLANGRCTIHAAKPAECRETMACRDSLDVVYERRMRGAMAWCKAQAELKQLGLEATPNPTQVWQ